MATASPDFSDVKKDPEAEHSASTHTRFRTWSNFWSVNGIGLSVVLMRMSLGHFQAYYMMGGVQTIFGGYGWAPLVLYGGCLFSIPLVGIYINNIL